MAKIYVLIPTARQAHRKIEVSDNGAGRYGMKAMMRIDSPHDGHTNSEQVESWDTPLSG